jgi:hypothetical protein
VVLAGAWWDDDNGNASGSAYVYRWDGTSWVERAKLLPSDGARDDGFESSVAVSGDVAVVGVKLDDDYGRSSGAAYVFSNLRGSPACGDGIDNDGDGLFDLDDPGCTVPLDSSEHSSLLRCDDGLDNDGDGLIDFPEDPGCANLLDQWEGIDCDDGIDNDGDGFRDFPEDLGCDGLEDGSEWSAGLLCDDGLDNDGDGLIDFPEDPGCADLSDQWEEIDCDDGIDNDGDGFIDFPADPGCAAAESDRENPQCQDGIDNDGDGLIDFDGGLSALGYTATDPDPQCVGQPWKNDEGCGLGWELGPVLAGLMLVARRRRLSR